MHNPTNGTLKFVLEWKELITTTIQQDSLTRIKKKSANISLTNMPTH